MNLFYLQKVHVPGQREAFEQDKKEGKEGRATRQLIQSTYFPW